MRIRYIRDIRKSAVGADGLVVIDMKVGDVEDVAAPFAAVMIANGDAEPAGEERAVKPSQETATRTRKSKKG